MESHGKVNTSSDLYFNFTGDENYTTEISLHGAEEFFDPFQHRDPLYVVIPVTFIYVIIFITGKTLNFI